MSNIYTAANQYAHRPKDERFDTLDALIADAQADRKASAERLYNLRDLRAVVLEADGDRPAQVGLESPRGVAQFTHWSFGQAARTVGAPGAYLRKLPPDLAAANLNYGLLHGTPPGTTGNVLAKQPDGQPAVIRALTSETYGRAWDDSLYGELARHFGDGVRTYTSGSREWQTPATWDGTPAGNYRGDRTSFVIRVDGGSMVMDRSTAKGDGVMFRGLMVSNSEVGASSINIETVLFKAICGNHILWGAAFDKRFRRRHVGRHAVRDALRFLLRLAREYADRPASQDELLIQRLSELQIATTPEGIVDELQKLGATKTQATEALATATETEPNPRSYWAVAQGLTANSQASGWQDARLDQDLLAAKLLSVGRQRVAVTV